MSGQTPPTPILDPFDYLQIVPNPDGSITRKDIYPRIAATPEPDPGHSTPVLSKDIPINLSKKTWARIYLRHQVLDTNSKLPLIVYYHGGGFIVLSADMLICHDLCSSLAMELPAVVVSVEYRLAPEHRLPAAYDDAMEALHWINNSQEDQWLAKYADLSNCYLMGSSAGGNIVYQAGLLAAEAADDQLEHLKIRGLILHHPFFGGVDRSGSELRSMNDPVLPPMVTDLMWELSLPIGFDRDHEYCNPTAAGGSKLLKMKSLACRVLVIGCEGDPLVDRQKDLFKMMEDKGVQVSCQFTEGGCHGVELFDASRAKALYMLVKDFVSSSKPAP